MNPEISNPVGGPGLPSNWTVPELEAYLQAHPVTDADGQQWRLSIHKLANCLPRIVGEAYEAFKRSIKLDGLESPLRVMVDADEVPGVRTGQVLDGRNRLGVCLELGIPVKIQIDKTGDPMKTVLNLNVARRHLSKGQCAATVVLADLSGNLRSPVGVNYTVRELAGLAGVGREAIELVRKFRESAPDLFDQVHAGAMSVNQADEAYQKRQTDRYALLEPEINVMAALIAGSASGPEYDATIAALQSQPPVPPGSPPPKEFIGRLEAALEALKLVLPKLARVHHYLSLRRDFPLGSACAQCGWLEGNIATFISDHGIKEELRRAKFLPE